MSELLYDLAKLLVCLRLLLDDIILENLRIHACLLQLLLSTLSFMPLLFRSCSKYSCRFDVIFLFKKVWAFFISFSSRMVSTSCCQHGSSCSASKSIFASSCPVASSRSEPHAKWALARALLRSLAHHDCAASRQRRAYSNFSSVARCPDSVLAHSTASGTVKPWNSMRSEKRAAASQTTCSTST